MIYLFTGTDTEATRAKAFAWARAARAKAPDAPYLRLAAGEITADVLDGIARTRGLFFDKMLVLLDDPFSLTESGDSVMAALPDLRDSENPIAILAPKLSATRFKKLETAAVKTFALDARAKKAARGFNAPLVNALGAKNGALLWKEIVKAGRAGDTPEMLHGLLHWKARDLMKKTARGWSREEARSLSLALIALHSEARSGALPLALALERFALSL